MRRSRRSPPPWLMLLRRPVPRRPPQRAARTACATPSSSESTSLQAEATRHDRETTSIQQGPDAAARQRVAQGHGALACTTASRTTSRPSENKLVRAVDERRVLGRRHDGRGADKQGLRVVSVFEGSPAASAPGSSTGDVIIEGERRSRSPASRATSRPPRSRASRAPPSRSTVDREGRTTPRTVTRQRGHGSRCRSLHGRAWRRVARQEGRASSELSSFTAGAHGELACAGRTALRSAARRASCSTCAATAAGCSTRRCWSRACSSPDGVIVTTNGRTQPEAGVQRHRRHDHAQGRWSCWLTAARRAPSEIVTGALHDRDRAHGGGRAHLRQGRLRAGDRAAAERRRARPHRRAATSPPNGENLNGKGIRPDVPARGQPEDAARRGARHRAEHGARQGRLSSTEQTATRQARGRGPMAPTVGVLSQAAGGSRWPSRCSSAARGDCRSPARRRAARGSATWCSSAARKRGARGDPHARPARRRARRARGR